MWRKDRKENPEKEGVLEFWIGDFGIWI